MSSFALSPTRVLGRLNLLSSFAIVIFASVTPPALAQDGRTFVINDDSGYGISDCFATGVACGKTVADTWCSSQGRGPAVAFGLASDVTAAIPAGASKVDANAIIITCGD